MQSVCLSIMPACDRSQQDKPVILMVHLSALIYRGIIIVVISEVVIVINVYTDLPLLQDNSLAAHWLRCSVANQ